MVRMATPFFNCVKEITMSSSNDTTESAVIPKGYWANANGGRVSFAASPQAAVAGADCVVTDTWVSMNHKDRSERINLLLPYRVDEALMALAGPGAVFMHCLPAHRGEEVTDAVIDGKHSVVWDEAENRLHIQKAILAWCLLD